MYYLIKIFASSIPILLNIKFLVSFVSKVSFAILISFWIQRASSGWGGYLRISQRPKHKSWNYTTFKRQYRGKSSWLQIWQWYLGYDTKAKAEEEKQIGVHQNWKCLCIRGQWRVKKTTHKMEKKISYVLNTEYVKNPENSAIKNRTIQK